MVYDARAIGLRFMPVTFLRSAQIFIDHARTRILDYLKAYFVLFVRFIVYKVMKVWKRSTLVLRHFCLEVGVHDCVPANREK